MILTKVLYGSVHYNDNLLNTKKKYQQLSNVNIFTFRNQLQRVADTN